MRLLTTLFLLIITSIAFGQKPLIRYDLRTGNSDTLNIPSFDTTLISESTGYFVGNFDSKVAQLKDEPPTSDLYVNSQFSLKKKASLEVDPNTFPVRTSLKIFLIEDDSMIHNCTASMISTRHAAAHCLASDQNLISADSILVCPVYDNGDFSQNFDCSYAKIAYFFQDYILVNGEDFLILELEDPIGAQTGWIGIGFNQNDNLPSDQIFYRFSYPSISIPQFDENKYNGDTLYLNYGIADLVEENFIGIYNASGIPGESGSSLINVENFTSHGVTTFSSNLKHSKLVDWTYFAIKSIIASSLKTTLGIGDIVQCIKIFPNPASHILNINSCQLMLNVSIIDMQGYRRKSYSPQSGKFSMSIDEFKAGMYFLELETQEGTIFKKFLIK